MRRTGILAALPIALAIASVALGATAPAYPNKSVRLVVPFPAEFGGFIRSEVAKWAKMVKEAGIQPE